MNRGKWAADSKKT